MFSWRKYWNRRIKEAQERLTMPAEKFAEKYGQILEGPKPWTPGEPAQSILRAMIKNRRRFVTQLNRRSSSTSYTALDIETGRTFWLTHFYGGCSDSSYHCSDGLSVKEMCWIKDEYIKHKQALQARAARISAARTRAQIMLEYVK